MEETKLQKVTDVLKGKGLSDETIGSFLADLTKASFASLYSTAASLFDSSDLQEIEACGSQEQANKLIAQKYFEKTGISAQDANKKFIDDFCTKFLEDYLGTQTQ